MFNLHFKSQKIIDNILKSLVYCFKTERSLTFFSSDACLLKNAVIEKMTGNRDL